VPIRNAPACVGQPCKPTHSNSQPASETEALRSKDGLHTDMPGGVPAAAIMPHDAHLCLISPSGPLLADSSDSSPSLTCGRPWPWGGAAPPCPESCQPGRSRSSTLLAGSCGSTRVSRMGSLLCCQSLTTGRCVLGGPLKLGSCTGTHLHSSSKQQQSQHSAVQADRSAHARSHGSKSSGTMQTSMLHA
jgi:hypothetical protein